MSNATSASVPELYDGFTLFNRSMFSEEDFTSTDTEDRQWTSYSPAPADQNGQGSYPTFPPIAQDHWSLPNITRNPWFQSYITQNLWSNSNITENPSPHTTDSTQGVNKTSPTSELGDTFSNHSIAGEKNEMVNYTTNTTTSQFSSTETPPNSREPSTTTHFNLTSTENGLNFSSVLEHTTRGFHSIEIGLNVFDSTLTNTNTTSSTGFSTPGVGQTSERFPYWSLGAYGDDDGVTTEVIIKVLVLVVICVAGTVGNLLVIWTVVKERNLHRPPFYFLLSLGVTDLSRAVFCLPVMIATVLHGSTWKHGESACELFAFATAFFVFSSALSLLAVAVDRHISLLHPRAYRRRSHGGANILAAVLIWIIAFSISFPPVIGAGRYVFAPEEAHCAFQHSHYSKNDSLSSAIILLVILFVTFLLYFRIYRFLRAHRRMRPLAHVPAQSSSWAFVGQGANGQAFINWLNGFGGQAAVRQEGQRVVQRLNFGRVVNLSTMSNKNEHLTRLFLILTLVFLFSWLPYIIVSLIRVFSSSPPSPPASSSSSLSSPSSSSSSSNDDNDAVSPITALISSWLGYAQVALCPVTFFLTRGPAGRRRKGLRRDYSLELAETERHKFLLENPIRK